MLSFFIILDYRSSKYEAPNIELQELNLNADHGVIPHRKTKESFIHYYENKSKKLFDSIVSLSCS